VTRSNSSGGRRTIGVRGKILAVGAAGMTAAAAVGVLGVVSLENAAATLDEVDGLRAALSDVQDIETSNSDVTGWQASYAWDTRRIGGAAAVADDNGNRAGFLDSAGRLREHLAAFPTEVLTGEESAIFATIQATGT
jgi:methyl-accepting chemotaxis protein